jgi:4,5-dihydroxyphthalate decarboxylase
MADLKLSFACGPYDRIEAMRDGRVKAKGIELDHHVIQAPREIFDRMVGDNAFDAAELSASEFISMTGAGKCPFVAIPVFPSKVFRHGFTCINTRAGISKPKDLEGKRVGLPLYTQTAAIWVRGQWQHEYGIDLSTITWVQGAIEKAAAHGTPHALPLLKPANIEVNDSGHSLSDLLAQGGIDATMGSRMPDSVFSHPDDVVRLSPDFREEEKEYYRRTKIHPIMHLVAIQKSIYEKEPWIAQSLYDAFCQSRDLAWDELRFSGAQRYLLPWLYADVAEIETEFGGDPWPYGIEKNRPTMEALVQYMVEQDFISERILLEDLFVDVED